MLVPDHHHQQQQQQQLAITQRQQQLALQQRSGAVTPSNGSVQAGLVSARSTMPTLPMMPTMPQILPPNPQRQPTSDDDHGFNEEVWARMPAGPAAPNARRHIEMIPDEVLFARLAPRGPLPYPLRYLFRAAAILTAVAYAVYKLIVSRTADRAFGIVLLAMVVFLVLHGPELLPGEYRSVRLDAEGVLAARMGQERCLVRRGGKGDKPSSKRSSKPKSKPLPTPLSMRTD